MKGRSKGAGKGRAKPQLRRELAGVVSEVLRGSGEDVAATQKGKGKKAKGKGKGKGKNKGAVVKPSRRQERRGKRAEAKARRAHFFGEGRRQGDTTSSRRGGAALTAAGTRRAAGGGKSVSTGASAAPKASARKRNRRRDDDDEEITSSEEDGEQATGKKTRTASSDEEGEDGVSDAEEEEAEEEIKDSDEPEDDSEKSEEAEEKETRVSDVDGILKQESRASTSKEGGYVPPHLRKAANGRSSAGLVQKRQLQGAMNKVSEGNLDPSFQELCTILNTLVPEVGLKASSASLMDVLVPAAVGDPNLSVLVLGCHAALAVASHIVFGVNFGAAALLRAGSWFQQRLEAGEASGEAVGEDSRVAKNCVIFICLLFSFGLLGGSVIFDLVRFIFSGQISELRVELALTVLRYSGRSLRSEYTEDFKEVIKFVADSATAVRGGEAAPEGSEIRSRVDYLLRELQDLKNNKVSFAVMDRFDMTRNWLSRAQLLGNKKVSDHQLALPFKFLKEDPPEAWPAGNASAGSASRLTRLGRKPGRESGEQVDALREQAVAQRLSTELRQSLFVALMGAEDFEHAAERLALVAAGAKAGTGEACLVIFHCAIREKVPNPFYEHVGDSLCARPAPWGKRFQHNLKRAAVQNLQQVHTFGVRAAVGLAELLAAYIAIPAIGVPLAVVRFIRFDEAGGGGLGGGSAMGGVLGLFLRHLVESLLQRLMDGSAAAAVFGALQKYDDVREGMLLIVDGHVRPRAKPAVEAPAFWEKMRAARKELVKRSSHV